LQQSHFCSAVPDWYRRKPAWIASLSGFAATVVLAGLVMDACPMLFSSVLYGAAFGLFPIGWWCSPHSAVSVMQESGKFETLKDSIVHLTDDGRLQMMLVRLRLAHLSKDVADLEPCRGRCHDAHRPDFRHSCRQQSV